MNQRDVILAAWQKRKATRTPSPHVQLADEFFSLMESRTDICWEEFSEEFRTRYYDAFDEIVPALLATDDPLIIHNLVRFADLSEPKEAEAAKKLINTADIDKHEVTMARLATDEAMRPAIKNRSQLPESVKAALIANNIE
jgi:hypothetical protein